MPSPRVTLGVHTTVRQQFVSVRQTVTNSLSPFDKLWTNCAQGRFCFMAGGKGT